MCYSQVHKVKKDPKNGDKVQKIDGKSSIEDLLEG